MYTNYSFSSHVRLLSKRFKIPHRISNLKYEVYERSAKASEARQDEGSERAEVPEMHARGKRVRAKERVERENKEQEIWKIKQFQFSGNAS
jgi:hypothetical protein